MTSTLLVADDLIEVSGELQEGQERRGKTFLHDLDLLNAIATDDVHLSSTAQLRSVGLCDEGEALGTGS